MNRLEAHLNRCLHLHTCVLLPGIGAFVCEQIAARYDASANLAYPPHEEMRFNAALTHHDGILEESYAQSYGISHRRARVMLDEDIRLLRAELLHNASVKLDKIGSLSLNEEGKLQFAPTLESDYVSIAYGLVPCSLPFLNQSAQIEQIEQTTLPESVATLPLPRNRDKRYLYFKLSKRSTAIAAAVVVALVLSVLPFRQVSAPEHFSASFVPTELAASKLWSSDEDASSAKQYGGGDAITPESVAKATPSESVATNNTKLPLPLVQEPTGQKYYYVILATFSNKDSAIAYCNETDCLEKVASSFLLMGKSKVRVAANRFESSTDAYNYIKDLAKQYPKFKSSWVYEAK